MSADRPAPAPDTVTDDLRMVAYRSARDWAAEHRHPQPDDRMIDAALEAVVPLIRERLAAEIEREASNECPVASTGGRKPVDAYPIDQAGVSSALRATQGVATDEEPTDG